ncbi:uncharacterized protein LTR77_007800 [Saxophila tyrrhenica]|uniref:PAS domain-containing protein n=1 Tax=Saxophila tyrrhenica TaxID=1690608 RepID=A0AAV9P3K8_9PEZI|nr:hypothetical protein LTR77_007800 [Saxophila tyrrhenica]
METTFISIHNLEDDAAILYTSDSIIDILGYTPDEVVGRSAWEFFPKDELPYAQKFHQKKVTMDKAAVLAYCRVRTKDGEWIGCECCFSIVYDVMIVCTSIYKRGLSSQKRALEAPVVRRMFTSSPKDPRYHMLSHISHKFAQPSKQQQHEPRAALFLNRFTRTLSIMYATAGIQDILGISADEMRGRSFYYCIAENCLQDAVKCLEQAKSNDSIAYLRFWFRDPRLDDNPPPPDDDSDEEMTTNASVDNEEGGVHLRSRSGTSNESAVESGDSMDVDTGAGSADETRDSRNSSNDSTRTPDTHEAIFGEPRQAHSSASSLGESPDAPRPEPVELEAVISCASDGLVVCLRKARPVIPAPTHRPSRPFYENGLFAAPWADEPIVPRPDQRSAAGFTPTFAPSLGPHGAYHNATAPPRATTASDKTDFMNAIRDQAVFAWALTGINGTIAEFAQGKPMGESLPADGLPVWASDRRQVADGDARSNGWHNGREMLGSASRSPQDGKVGVGLFGDPGLDRKGGGGNGNGSAGGSSSYGGSGGGTPGSGPR